MSNRHVKLTDVCERIDYGLTASANNSGNGPRFLRITDIVNSPGDLSGVPGVEISDADREKYRLCYGDIVVARTGATVGASYWLGRDDVDVVFASYLVRFRMAPGVSSRYVGYVLRSSSWRDYVSSNAHSKSAQPNMSAKVMGEFAFDLPSLEVQSCVAAVLGTIDDKIAANRRLESSLWQMIDAKAKFASSVEQNFVALGDLVRLNYGRALPVARRRGGEVTVMGSGGEVGRHDEALVSGPSVIVGRKGTVGATYWVDGPAYPIDTTYWVEPVGVPLLYAYTVLKSIDFSGMSTDSAVPGLNRDRAYAIPVALPSPERLRTFELCTASLVERAAAANDENLRLAATRDELLPLLMSGKITVKDAEKTVEEVV